LWPSSYLPEFGRNKFPRCPVIIIIYMFSTAFHFYSQIHTHMSTRVQLYLYSERIYKWKSFRNYFSPFPTGYSTYIFITSAPTLFILRKENNLLFRSLSPLKSAPPVTAYPSVLCPCLEVFFSFQYLVLLMCSNWLRALLKMDYYFSFV